MKRMMGLILAGILLLMVFPMSALAEDPSLKVTGAGTFEYDGSAHTVSATVQDAGTDTYKIEYSVNGGDYETTAPSKSEVGTYNISIKATNETNTEATPLSKTVKLEITEPAPKAKLVLSGGGTFTYDGSAHAVTASIENGSKDDYDFAYTVNGATVASVSLTDPGSYSVQVTATPKGTGDTLTENTTVKIEEKATLKITGNGTFEYDSSKEQKIVATVENGFGTYTIEYSDDGGSTKTTSPIAFKEIGKYTVTVYATNGTTNLSETATIEITAPSTEPKLKAESASFPYDGNEHKLPEAKVENGTGYTIEYSTDGGTSWTETVPSAKEPGKTTVKIRARKDMAETLTTADVTLEIVAGPTLKAESSKFDYDGNEHALKAATVENGEGYTIEYSTDAGKTWTTVVPKRKDVGKDTVKIRATKSGEATLTTEDVTLEIVKKTIETITIVNCNNSCNVRKGPSSSSEKIGTAKKGNVYPYLGKEGKYYKIQYKEGVEGYVHEDYAKKGESPAPDSDPSGKTLTIVNCNEWVNVRAGGNSSTKKIGVALKGEKYTYLGKSGNYYKIQYTSSTVGFVHKKYSKISGTDPEPTGDKVVSIVNCKEYCNVRAGGSSNTALIGTAPRGKTYTYLGQSGNYYKIQYTDKTVGYVHKNYSKIVDGKVTPDPEPTGDKTGVIYNCKTMVNVREKATSSSALLGTIKKGVTVTILGYEGNWTKVKYGTGTAYIFSKYVKAN